MIPKEIKYYLQYDDVRGDFTAATRHITSYSRVKIKVKKGWFGNKEHTKSRKSETQFDWVSSFATL